jgi:glycolate oxidase iron-sulfur subunit
MVEDAREQIEAHASRGLFARILRRVVFRHVLASPGGLSIAGTLLYLYQVSGLKKLVGGLGFLKLLGRLGELHELAPEAQPPFFFSRIGKTFPAEGTQKHRVAFLAGCIANVAFARLNDATVRVLQKNGCEVVIPAGQGCCGALHLHAGLREDAQDLARRNIDAFRNGRFDAIITNASGCGSATKEYGDLLAGDPRYAAKAAEFAARVRDISEFLATIELNTQMGPVDAIVTYQDSCHLAHGQRVRSAPRKLLAAVPGLTFQEMPGSDICCGSAGIYNVLESEMAARILATKMMSVNATRAGIVATANPGCMLQLQAGVRTHGAGQRVMHVVEILDEAYRNAQTGAGRTK